MILTHVDLIEKLLKYVPSADKAETAKSMREAACQQDVVTRYNASEREQARAARQGR
jgi:hypothetical protein